jgi:hypothetical protein
MRYSSYGTEAGRAGAVNGVEGGGGGDAGVVGGHATGFGPAELGEDGPDHYVVDFGGVEVGVFVDYCFEYLGGLLTYWVWKG